MPLLKISEMPTIGHHHLLEVLTNVPFPIMLLHGPSHLVLFSNHVQCEALHGGDPLGKPFSDAFAELSAHFLPVLDAVYRDGIARHEKEVQIGEHFLNVSCLPMRDESGRIEGVIVSALDVTAEVAVREATENQKKWLEFVLDLIPVPTILVEPGSGEVLLINAAGKRQMTGYPNDPNLVDAEKYYFTDLSGNRLAPSDWPRFRAARGEELFGLQLIWNSPAGQTPFVVDSRKLPQAFGHPAVVSLHYHDVSELKRAELALRESIEDLQRERELRERFVSTLTHDLRNPLTAAKLNAQILARENPRSESIGKLSGRICGNIARADQMVCDLLDANRLKAGENLPLRIGNHSLGDIARKCLDGLGALYGDRFRLEIAEPIRGRWCRSSLKRVFENLCGNAVKYGALNTPITVSLVAEGEAVSIFVHNYGNPIPRDEQPGLFLPYHRTKSAKIGPQHGWGLGLALVRGIAEAHGGRVGLDYSDERGTRFAVHLPRITVPQTP